jgi:hypothetical protein
MCMSACHLAVVYMSPDAKNPKLGPKLRSPSQRISKHTLPRSRVNEKVARSLTPLSLPKQTKPIYPSPVIALFQPGKPRTSQPTSVAVIHTCHHYHENIASVRVHTPLSTHLRPSLPPSVRPSVIAQPRKCSPPDAFFHSDEY